MIEMTKVLYEKESGWHKFRTEDKSIGYDCIVDTFEEAVTKLIFRYNLKEIVIIDEKSGREIEIKEEIEVCPHCEAEVTVVWDVEKQGYQTVCPSCGKEIMLCDACLHSEDNEGMDCDWLEEKGCFRHPKGSK